MQKFPSDVLSELRQHLEGEKTGVSARIGQLSAQDPFSDPDRVNDNAASDADASEESSHDRFQALVEQQQLYLAQIEQALARIADGSYGFCSNCHQMIDTDRLAILPTATLCLRCEREKKAQRP